MCISILIYSLSIDIADDCTNSQEMGNLDNAGNMEIFLLSLISEFVSRNNQWKFGVLDR